MIFIRRGKIIGEKNCKALVMPEPVDSIGITGWLDVSFAGAVSITGYPFKVSNPNQKIGGRKEEDIITVYLFNWL